MLTFSSSTTCLGIHPRKQLSHNQGQNKFWKQQEETIEEIWNLYRTGLHVKLSQSLYAAKMEILPTVIELHRLMKLPIQALHIAVNLFDRFLAVEQVQKEHNLLMIGVACLYCSHKLEKTRSQPISAWVKAGPSLNLPFTIEGQALKILEGRIMQALNYQLVTPNIFEIMMAFYTKWSPSQKQFYFSQYLLELTIFTDFKKYYQGEEESLCSAETICQEASENLKFSQGKQNLYLVHIVWAICQLSIHFFPEKNNLLTFQKTKQQQKIIKKLSNIIFLQISRARSNPLVSEIVRKYEKQANMGVSCLKFKKINSSDESNNEQTQIDVYINQ